jgi:DNA-binding transcriptional ArsR family regulator
VNSYTEAASKLKVMGHPVRLHILDMLRHGEICVCHIETALGKRQAYISQHLMTLRDAGLVSARKDGLQVYYRLSDDLVVDILNLIYGISEQSQAEVLNDCPCPQCATISIATIE